MAAEKAVATAEAAEQRARGAGANSLLAARGPVAALGAEAMEGVATVEVRVVAVMAAGWRVVVDWAAKVVEAVVATEA